ncbi:MAG: S8 family peptidase [Verrucomicrobiales bacterium]
MSRYSVVFLLTLAAGVSAEVIENGRGVCRERLVVSPPSLRKATQAMSDRGPELWVEGCGRNPAGRRVVTGRLLVKMAAQTDASALARDYIIELVASPAYAPELRVFHCLPVTAIAALRRLRRDPRVVEADLILGKPRTSLGIPDDFFFPQQWHLRNTGQNGGVAGVDINVEPIWGTFGGAGVRGAGVRIAIIDDGVETDHPDLNFDTANDHDWNDDTPDDPKPGFSTDVHGTAVAGVAAAIGNNALGVCGVAPEAVLVGERLLGGNRDGFPATVDDFEEAEAFAWLVNAGQATIHIKNNSWGVPDLVKALDGPGPLASAALRFGAVYGRHGLGTINVFAGGNGGSRPLAIEAEDSNFNGYANSIYAIAVAGITDAGTVAYYSERGANLLICAPAQSAIDDAFHFYITTTDRTGVDGYNTNAASANNAFTRTFNGTSAATPIVSGVCALMLATNPQLGWRDVQEILLRTARRIQPADDGWSTNGAGFHFHHDFGTGLVDATAACQMAATWTNLDHMKTVSAENTEVTAILDNEPNGITVTFQLPAAPFRIEHVTVRVKISHPERGQLGISLQSPFGTSSEFSRLRADPNDNFDDWTFSTVRCWGEGASGLWTLKVADVAAGETGTFQNATITAWGTSPVPDAYETWLRGAFGDAIVDNLALRGNVWGHAADPDTDGFGNLAEAYFGMNPTLPDVPPQWTVEHQGVDLAWRWVPSAIPGLEFVPEWSDDLVRWHRSGELVDGTTRTITVNTVGAYREAVLAVGTLQRAALRLVIARM